MQTPIYKLIIRGTVQALGYKFMDLYIHAKRNSLRGTVLPFDANLYTLSIIKERGLLV